MSESAPEFQPAAAARPVGPTLDASFALVASDLDAVEAKLADLLQSSIAIIPEVSGHLAFAGGKRFRPLVTLLAAKAAGYGDDARIALAAAGELLHTATLLHDDVIDGGTFRRGRVTARLAYGNGMAVLTGDFCFARALHAVAQVGRLRAVETLSRAVTRMAEGEVAQLNVAGDFSLDHERYYAVIDRKTAALIAWCCSLGGLPAAPVSEALSAYGLHLGYAFQIADDILDYALDVETTGKARAQDLRDGKMTLPLVLACERDTRLQTIVRTALEGVPPVDEMAVHAILEHVMATNALALASDVARTHAGQAVAALRVLPPSRARDALENLADYVVERCA